MVKRGGAPCMVAIQRILLSSYAPIQGLANHTAPIMEGVIYMKQFKEQKLNRKDYLFINVLATIVRVLLTPIFIWYRLYLWVWDGTMFDKN